MLSFLLLCNHVIFFTFSFLCSGCLHACLHWSASPSFCSLAVPAHLPNRCCCRPPAPFFAGLRACPHPTFQHPASTAAAAGTRSGGCTADCHCRAAGICSSRRRCRRFAGASGGGGCSPAGAGPCVQARLPAPGLRRPALQAVRSWGNSAGALGHVLPLRLPLPARPTALQRPGPHFCTSARLPHQLIASAPHCCHRALDAVLAFLTRRCPSHLSACRPILFCPQV